MPDWVFYVQAESSAMNFFRYSPAVNITAAYPKFVPSGNSVCVVLIETPILENSFFVLSIDAFVGRLITLVVVFPGVPWWYCLISSFLKD